MKRAVFILLAALLVLLVYPSTHPYAKSAQWSGSSGPSIMSPKTNGDPIAFTDDSDGGSDDGDSDDVAGWKNRGDGLTRSGNGMLMPTPTDIRLVFKMWWNLMIWIR